MIHFVGFRDDRYWNAVRVFGLPDFIHRGWDLRAQREISEEDVVIFTGEEQAPRRQSYDDLNVGSYRRGNARRGT